MTRIDFHSNISDLIAYTCRLTRKARAADCTVVLLAKDQTQLAELDDALWTFSELDFLPHVTSADKLASRTPIILTDNESVDLPHHQILINLSGNQPSHFARFERLFEVISSKDADKLAARERYVFYKQRGYPLTHFDSQQS
jgi:DNA polymerase-3 subunit chi